MSAKTQRRQNNYVDRPGGGGLPEAMELILDKGLIVDTFVRMSLAEVELATIDSRMVIASIDTYLRFADAVSRLAPHQHGGKDRTELSQNMPRVRAEQRGEITPAHRGNGAHHTADTKPQTHTPGHLRPYDWKNSFYNPN